MKQSTLQATAPDTCPPPPPVVEVDQAVALLRHRLDRDLVDRWEAQGDLPTALLEHLRQRKTPKSPFSADDLPTIARRAREQDPDEYAWEKRIADEAVAGRVYAATNPYCDRFVKLNREMFSFTEFNYPDDSTQALAGLNRQRWYQSLATAYWDDQDPAYFSTLMDEWDFYARVVPPPTEAMMAGINGVRPWQTILPPYRELDMAIRLRHWWWAYWLSLHSPLMTPERNAVLLARCILLLDYVAARGVNKIAHNFTAMYMESVHLWALMLPEITGLHVLKHASRNILTASLNVAVGADGVHWEMSTSYHAGCIGWYGFSCLLGQRNGQHWGKTYEDKLRHMGEHLDAVITPDGNIPTLSDSDRVGNWRRPLSLLYCLFPDLRFHRPVPPSYGSVWASGGKVWEPQETLGESLSQTSVYPDAGLAVVRHPDPELGAMVLFDNGPNAPFHAHNDNLSLQYDALGKPVLLDAGRYVYENQAPERQWIIGARSHNTIYIEDQPAGLANEDQPMFQTIDHTTDPRVAPITTQTADGVVRLSTSFRGHLADSFATTHRTVLFPVEGDTPWVAVLDRIEGPDEHTWTNSWLIPSEAAVQYAKEKNLYTAKLDNGLTLRFVVAGSDELSLRDEAMFWTPNYAEKSPARWLRFSSPAKQGHRAFLFLPSATPKAMDHDPAIRITKSDVSFEVDGQILTLPR